MSVEMVEMSVKTAGPPRPAGIPQQNRVFLDFFWDLAKPEQEVRLKAIEDLIQYLKTNNKASQQRRKSSGTPFLCAVSHLNTLRCVFRWLYSFHKCPVAAVLFVCCVTDVTDGTGLRSQLTVNCG